MVARLFFLVIIGLVAASASIAAETPPSPTERVIWDYAPIPVALSVGKERRIQFSEPVQAEMPVSLKSTLRTQWVDNYFYWLADDSFAPTRIRLRTADGRYLLIDLSAASDGPSHPLEIFIPNPVPNPVATDAATAPNTSTAPEERRHGNIDLTRLAAREFYGPSRLRMSLDSITPLTVPAAPIPLYQGASVSAKALAAWHAGDRVISAIEVCNRTTETVVLDPRRIRARPGCGYGTCLIAATFQHNTLAPRDTDRPCSGYDVTALYLITSRPLTETVPVPLEVVER